ncbi:MULTISPECIES: thioesterase II family protein [unclassified Streptomyces]|uniref:thioesterase II family protein n=1 Tax=unclassified Streptomyces TaxID=2593676 RepID=UPI00340BDB96
MSGAWIAGRTDATGSAPRLFCFAHAGGGGAFFHPWRTALRPHVEVCPVVLPGREGRGRETPYTRMGPLIEDLADGLAPHLDRPYAFFGHSLGSIVAYETARLLRDRGATGPAALLVSGRRGPYAPTDRPAVHHLPDEEFLAEVTGLGGTPPQVLRQRELLRLFLPALRADYELNETYRPVPPPAPALTCPVFAYTGDADPLASPHQVARWRDVTSGDFLLRVLPGDHFYLKEAPDGLMTALRTALSTVHRESTTAQRPLRTVGT